MSVVYSAVQSSGRLHVGNWVGALRPWTRLQRQPHFARLVFAVADLHALTSRLSSSSSSSSSCSALSAARTLLAAGLQPSARLALYRQSDLGGQHAQLMWLLACVAQTSWLQRMVHYKDKARLAPGSDTLALLAYPVLQAADILLFDAQHVPVGEDQLQNLELARDIATAFNARCGAEVLKKPTALLAPETRVMSLRNPSQKMSKTEEKGCLFLDDEPDVIASKIAKAVTDSDAGVEYDEARRPELAALLRLYGAVAEVGVEALPRFASKAALKSALTELLVETLAPLRARAAQLSDEEVRAVLREGAQRAALLAEPALLRAKQAAGLKD